MYRTLEYYSPGGLSGNDISESDDPLALATAVSIVGSEAWLQDLWDNGPVDAYTNALETIYDLGSLLVYEDLGFQPFALDVARLPFSSQVVHNQVAHQTKRGRASRNAIELGLPSASRADLTQIVELRTSDEFALFRERYSDLLSRITSDLPLEREEFDAQFYELANDLLRTDVDRLTRQVTRRHLWRDVILPGALLVGGTLLDFAMFHLPSASSLATGTVAADVAIRGHRQRRTHQREVHVLNILTSGLGPIAPHVNAFHDEILVHRHGR
jgi:hypothetical protein